MYEEKVNRDVQRERVKDYPTLIFLWKSRWGPPFPPLVDSPWGACALANAQQGPLVSKTVRLQWTWGEKRRRMRNRMIRAQQRGTFFKWAWKVSIAASFQRQPINITGNILITLQLLPCNSVSVTKHFCGRFIFHISIKLFLVRVCGCVVVVCVLYNRVWVN